MRHAVHNDTLLNAARAAARTATHIATHTATHRTTHAATYICVQHTIYTKPERVPFLCVR